MPHTGASLRAEPSAAGPNPKLHGLDPLLTAGAEFSVAYDNKGANVFHFVTPWSQPSASQTPEIHHNVVDVTPPASRQQWYVNTDIGFAVGSASAYSVKVKVPSPAHIRFAGRAANGTWRRLHTLDCEDDDDSTQPDADGPVDASGYTRTCVVVAPGITSFAVLTPDRKIPANVDLPSFEVTGITGFFSTFDECGVPRAGENVTCFQDGTPTCADTGGACGDSRDCCSGLSCSRGVCAAPSCQSDGGRCASSTDCCAGLGCSAGACHLP